MPVRESSDGIFCFLAFPAVEQAGLLVDRDQSLDPTKRFGVPCIPWKGSCDLAVYQAMKQHQDAALFAVQNSTKWLVMQIIIPVGSLVDMITRAKIQRRPGGQNQGREWHFRFTGSSPELMQCPHQWCVKAIGALGAERWVDAVMGRPGWQTTCCRCQNWKEGTWKPDPYNMSPSLCTECLFEPVFRDLVCSKCHSVRPGLRN